MKRVHVLELEDLSYFPAWLRDCMTENIVVMARWMGVPYALTQLLRRALEDSKESSIVDLGSGSGGVMPGIFPQLQAAHKGAPLSLCLTDRYPNQAARARLEADSKESIRYLPESVDARQLESAPPGLKTMVNCFHHMRPEEARAILTSAHEQRQPILIYEMAGHQLVPFPIWLIFLPLGLLIVFLMAFLKSFSVRPVTFRQLFFTLPIPLIPLCYAWDGQASMPRIYRPEDLDELLQDLQGPDYRWEQGFGQTSSGKRLGSYLLGLPVQSPTDGEGA